jgi:IclR family mhp operon transcriptional activator
LSDGYHEESWIAEIAQPRMDVLSREIVWPLTLATALGIQVIIRAVTQSPLTFVHVALGGRLPMVGSAAGRVHLAFVGASQRSLLLDLIRRSSDDPRDSPAHHAAEMSKIIEKVQKDGYAFYGADRRFSTCAVPIFSQRRNIAALVMRYPTMALRQSDVIKRYLPALRKCAREVGDGFDHPHGVAPAATAPRKASRASHA